MKLATIAAILGCALAIRPSVEEPEQKSLVQQDDIEGEMQELLEQDIEHADEEELVDTDEGIRLM